MTTVTISPKFQVVIPKHIRERLDLHPGQQVQAIEYGLIAALIAVVIIGALQALGGKLTGTFDAITAALP